MGAVDTMTASFCNLEDLLRSCFAMKREGPLQGKQAPPLLISGLPRRRSVHHARAALSRAPERLQRTRQDAFRYQRQCAARRWSTVRPTNKAAAERHG